MIYTDGMGSITIGGSTGSVVLVMSFVGQGVIVGDGIEVGDDVCEGISVEVASGVNVRHVSGGRAGGFWEEFVHPVEKMRAIANKKSSSVFMVPFPSSRRSGLVMATIFQQLYFEILYNAF